MAFLTLAAILSIAVLCVACANVAGLLLSRAPLRSRELAVRLAIGAGRGRLVAQLVTEGMLIALSGAVAGVAVGYTGIALINQIHYPTDIVMIPDVRMDARALTFSLISATVSALLFGLGPALQATRVDLTNSLRVTEGAAVRRWRLGGRSQLVALQVALSLGLLTVAAVTLQAFTSQFADGVGFRRTQMAKLSIDASQAGYRDAGAARFFETVVAGAQRIPGVRSASVTSSMPFWSFDPQPIVPEGYRLAPGEQAVVTMSNVIDELYFATMDIPIVRGRPFRSTDTVDAPRAAIVNETLAARYWPTQDAVGSRFRLGDERGPWVEIVGIAKDSKYGYFTEPPTEMLYLPFRQEPRATMTLLAHTVGASVEPLGPMQTLVRAMDAAVPVYDAQTIEAFYEARVTGLAGVVIAMINRLGIMGMTITVIGLYGLVSFVVVRRTREIGIRIAIGATYARVVGMILRQGLAPAAVGVVLGLGLSIWIAASLPSLVPIGGPSDLRVLLIVTPALVLVILGAAWIPARRAALINPTMALREE